MPLIFSHNLHPVPRKKKDSHFSTVYCERIGTMYATAADISTPATHLRSRRFSKGIILDRI